MTNSQVPLPRTVGSWTRPASPQVVNAQNIFDYMNGAGELYLGYGFDHLDVFTYSSPGRESILVEVYFMQTTDDAFGLLSLDWGGEAVELRPSVSLPDQKAPPSRPRALYGEGLVRLCAGRLFARIMAERETPDSRRAVLELGRSVAQGRELTPEPKLLQELPRSLAGGWHLLGSRASFFRSHLVLNSIYYLSSENLLDLGHDIEAVTAVYERTEAASPRRRLRWFGVRYPDRDAALEALGHFHRVYLPEFPFRSDSDSSAPLKGIFPIEDGWLGYWLKNDALTFLFECPDRETIDRIFASQ